MTSPAKDPPYPPSDLPSDRIKHGQINPDKAESNLCAEQTEKTFTDGSGQKNDGDPQNLTERLAAMESKMNDIVNAAFDIDHTPEPIRRLESDMPIPPFVSDSPSLADLELDHHLNFKFYIDMMWFMRSVKNSHRALVKAQKTIKQRREFNFGGKPKALTEQEPDSSKKLSTEAFLKGDRARIVQVDWDVFIASKGELENSILTPIEVVSTEPEVQTILQLPLSRADNSVKVKPGGHHTAGNEAGDRVQKSIGEQALPERIKIHSGPLVSIFCHIMRPRWDLAKDQSMVILRPFKQLVYHETQLRHRLFKLEKKFERYDGTQPKPSVPEGVKEKRLNSITGLLHMRCLMDFFDNNIKPKLEHIGSVNCTHVSLYDIWHLFKPGDKVVDQTEKQAYVIMRVQTPRHKVEDPWLRWYKSRTKDDSDDEDEGDVDPVTLHCIYIDFDGKQFGPVSKKFKIPQFGELKDIRSLPVYPLRYAKSNHLLDDLIKRGKMLLDVTKFKPMYYMGYTLDTRDEIDSQVVVDFNEALADETRRKRWEPIIGPVNNDRDGGNFEPCVAPCCKGQAVYDGEYIDSILTQNFVKTLVPRSSLRAPSLLLYPRPLEDILDNGDGLTSEELLVMTYRVFGFVLRSRKWAQLDLTFLRYENVDVRNSSINAFERLELPVGHREMVKSLVIQHFRSKQTAFTKDEQTDLIKGKGKGLIMLLHGAPGVGKTTTAEGIAELFKKPLFQITCGDLGTTAREVEEELESNFALASRWGCILLLDEADVFLAARDRMDFKRNGLVAVFLRVLEYYTGILFLTTNRIGDFDEAFASRVHMSLYYPELDEQKTLKVFELNLELIRDQFKRQGRKIVYDASSIEHFARTHYMDHRYNRLNGRQIRNLCQTALALAEFDAQGGELDAEIDRGISVSLQLKHFTTVQAAYLSFGEYLGDIRGTRGDRRAIDYGLRARQDTPYQTKSSRFSQKADEMASQNWHGQATNVSPSDHSHYRLASQGDPFQPLNQGYIPSGQGINVPPQGYRQVPQQRPQQMTSMGSMGFNMPPGFGQPGQSQADPRLVHDQQPDAQYMRYQQGSQGFPQYTNVNVQGSPITRNNFQGQQQEQGYGGVTQAQVPSISTASSSTQVFTTGLQTGWDSSTEQNYHSFAGNEASRM